MARDISDKLARDLHDKTRSELDSFLDQADALIKRGHAIGANRGPQSRHLLGQLLDRADALLSPKRPKPVSAGPSKLEQAKAFARANPGKAALVAVGVGLILKRMLSRG
ncbi:hypothetical protein NJC40_28685 [Pseudomonas sp. 21LCFQ02]|uniref:hypothetical protein n=1 Tax=unclassified Pseudomonas TaxID=196821 RepID=UPI00209AFF43|nr:MULTISPECIES: hypothetical protein [unclassified Pseudomonas]MCO8171747.1 hypothetical protein [Pseudomonas sp. 21LCFQ02]MCQ9425668.1 hypothetical protein [Pseudomonas sp. LJDD11]